MQELSKKSGGLVVLGDAFETRVFKDSFQKIFTKNANGQYSFAFNANIEIHVSDVLQSYLQWDVLEFSGKILIVVDNQRAESIWLYRSRRFSQ
jgi:hypothetical protein